MMYKSVDVRQRRAAEAAMEKKSGHDDAIRQKGNETEGQVVVGCGYFRSREERKRESFVRRG